MSVAATNYEGNYRLKEVAGDEIAAVVLPRDFDVKLEAVDGKPDEYNLYAKIGNNLSTRIKVSHGSEGPDALKLGMVRSSRMMPPQDIFKVEQALSSLLPDMNQIQLEGEELLLQGPRGKIICSKQA